MKKIIAAICVLLNVTVAYAEESVWLVQSHTTMDNIRHQQFQEYFVNPVNEELDGILHIQFLEQLPKESKSTNKDTFSALRYGQIQGMFMPPTYWGNIDPMFTIVGDLTAAWESQYDYLNWYESETIEPYIQNVYQKHNMIKLSFTVSPLESFISTIPINNIHDFKGKIVRVPFGTMTSEYVKHLGGYVHEIPFEQVRSALYSGKIEIADYSTLESNLDKGLYKKAKYTNYPGFHSLPVIDFVVNLYEWAKLSSSSQEVIMKHLNIWKDKSIQEMDALNLKAANNAEKYEIVMNRWTNEDLAEAREAAMLLWDEYAKKSADAAAVVNSVKSWIKEHRKKENEK